MQFIVQVGYRTNSLLYKWAVLQLFEWAVILTVYCTNGLSHLQLVV